jgi:hypothetical protein
MSVSNPSRESLHVDAAAYLALNHPPARVKKDLTIALSDHAYLPRVDDLTSDWVAHVATPAFKLIRQRKGGAITSFCSIGTGSGLDILAAIETLGASRVGLTDLQEDVVETAIANVRRNTLSSHSLVIEAGFGDLLAPLRPYQTRYELIYENLPNVPLPSAREIEVARTSSNCLAPRKESIPRQIGQEMLDLHYLALVQAQSYLADGGAVLSTVGARVPLDVLLGLGSLAGYTSSLLTYTWKVQADPHEIVAQHARKQQEGYGPFHFYRTDVLREAFQSIALGTTGDQALDLEHSLLAERLDARRAYAALQQGVSIGHTVAVLKSVRS